MDQYPALEPENGSIRFVNQNNFSYKSEHAHYIDSIDPRNYNRYLIEFIYLSPLVDHKYFALPETVS